MALSLGTGPTDGGPDGRQPPGDGAKTARLPRWTRQEILVLIQGKRVAENRVRRTRSSSGSAFGPGHVEPKWASISSYCKRHGVNRGPVQCRKRWSNLAGDYKKIKEWETTNAKDETESFWVMRNDLRREKKLPGFFDREVYDILDGGGGGGGGEEVEMGGGLSLGLGSGTAEVKEGGEKEVVVAAADDGREEAGPSKEGTGPAPISVAEKQYQSLPVESPHQGPNIEKEPSPEAEFRNAQEGRKRKRHATDEEGEQTTNLQHRLIEALEKNGILLSSQLEAQNNHLHLDREQRNDHVNSLLTVLNKLADALGRIADKL